MSFKEMLKENVPLRVRKTAEYAVFCKWCSQNNVNSASSAKSKVDAEVKALQKAVDKNRKLSGTNTSHARQAAKRLDFMKLCRDKILKYL